MTEDGSEPIIELLNGLVVAPPRDLVDRVVSRWTRVQGALADLYVAFSEEGISFARTAAAVQDSDEGFVEAFHRRFGRPLRKAPNPPDDLVSALRSGSSGSLRFDLKALSPFEREVLQATLAIPCGQTRPYAWVAQRIGRPRAVRAVGSALGRNPVPVLIPCHRVIRSDGHVGQYLYGSQVKEQLLQKEHQWRPDA